MIKKSDIVAAVNFLIESDNYTALINEITKIIERWDTHPMAYEGHLKVLNALVEVGLESREAFENVIELIERKRKLIPAIKRVDYQRTLMQARRARIAKALDLYSMSTGKSVTAANRANRVAEIQARWNAAKKKFLEAKGKLSWKDRNTATNEFWNMIDAQLDDNLKAAYKKSG